MKRPWLAPLVPLYAAGVALRARRFHSGSLTARRLKLPVISIGNLSTGGAGKTPLTIALARLLSGQGVHVDVLSRGYGRESKKTVRIDPDGTAEEFGDEPLLIARATGAPVFVAPQRYHAGLLAEADLERQQGASPVQSVRAHLLDDGFQHRQLHRDIDILLLHRDDLQDTLLPAGNLREPLDAARRATAIVIPAEDPSLESELRMRGLQAPIWRVHRTMQVPKTDGPVFAFCGIARPDQFFAGLESAGVRIAARHAFADHYSFTEHVIEWLTESARKAKAAVLMTTEKDAVRLGTLINAFPPDLQFKTVPLHVEIENAPAVVASLLSRLGLSS